MRHGFAGNIFLLCLRYLYVQIEDLGKFTSDFLPDPKLAKPTQPMHRDLTASVRQGAGWRGLDSPRQLGGHFTPTLGVSRRTEGGEPSIAVGSRGSSPGASQICVLRCAIVGRLVSNGGGVERDTDP
jgi:hypothetical protein